MDKAKSGFMRPSPFFVVSFYFLSSASGSCIHLAVLQILNFQMHPYLVKEADLIQFSHSEKKTCIWASEYVHKEVCSH